MHARTGVLTGIAAAIVAGGAMLAVPASAQKLVLYTASNPEIEKVVMEAFKKKHPDIKVEAINLSTGPVVQRAIAEKANPQADVIWMINDVALEQLKAAGVLEPYEPKNVRVPDNFRDPDGFWTAHNATVMAMAVNTKLLKEKNLPMPSTWEDLTKPVYKGAISVAAATKSGTGLSIATTMYDAYGWDFLDKLHANVFQYQSSGSAPARQAAAGEVVIGLTYDTAIVQQVRAGQPIEMVYGGLSPNVLEGAGLVAKGPNPKEGTLFMDFLFGPEAGKAFAPFVGIGAAPGVTNVDLDKVKMWRMKKPVDAEVFKREWAARYERK
ncbi:MAG: extracellular solute-binding protein [Alphaproteobacteria bacterium]|nr:extracellular solute-binding protein [Alphaproteobacteria bacterium]